MATDTELNLLLIRIKVKDQQIQDLQRKRADLNLEYQMKRAENELQDTKF